MKRTLTALLLTFCLLLSMAPQVAASETLQVGYIDAAMPITDISGDTLAVRIVSEKGASAEYTLADRARINTEQIRPGSAGYDTLAVLSDRLTDCFVQYALDGSGKISKIVYQDSCIVLADRTYNPATESFSGVYGDRAVFYRKGAYQPVLSAKHIYVIEDYSYALNITEIRAKDGMDTVLSIEASTGISSDFTGEICLDLLTDVTDGHIDVRLYDANGASVEHLYEDITPYGEAYIAFGNLPNETMLYTAELWIEDTQNIQTSYEYTLRIQFRAHPVTSVYVQNTAVVSDISGFNLQLLVRDINGSTRVCYATERLSVNGMHISFSDESALRNIAATLRGKLIRMAQKGTDITTIYYEDTPLDIIYGLPFDTQTGQLVDVDADLPVFYKNGIAPPYLDNNHTYDVQLYSYAANIVGMLANNGMVTVEPTKLSTTIEGDFCLWMGGDFSCSTNEGIAVFQLKDEAGQLLLSYSEDLSAAVSSFGFSKIPNESGNYTVSLWVENANGIRISPAYTFTHFVIPVSVQKGYIYATAPVSSISGQGIEVGIRLANGVEKSFSLPSSFYLDGTRIRLSTLSLTDLTEIIDRMTYVQFALDGSGRIAVLRSNTMHAQNKNCTVSNTVVYKDAIEATVQFSEDYTKETMLVLIALYDENGRMTGWGFEEVEVPADKSQSVQVQMATDASVPYTNGKVFMWESLLRPSR